MKIIDCLGEMCPIPIILLKKELSSIKNGSCVRMITDHSCSLTSIKDFCYIHGLHCQDIEEIQGVWEITISSKPFLE